MLRKINRKAKKRFFSLIFLFVFFISSQVVIFPTLVSPSVEEGDLSVEWGDNVYQNLPYNYTGTFYENTDPTDAWDTAKIEFTYIPDTTINDEYVITDSFENSETEYPSNASIIMVEGTHYQNGTLDDLDDDYHIFNSTTTSGLEVLDEDIDITEIENQDKRVERNNIRSFLNYTVFGNFADMLSIDDDYATFESEETGHYNATYSFTNETAGTSGVAISWVEANSFTTCEIDEDYAGHKKVMELTTDGGAWRNAERAIGNKASGTVEFWVRITGNPATTVFRTIFYDGAVIMSTFRFKSDLKIYLDTGGGEQFIANWAINTWYHVRFDFECGAGGYQGLAADRCYIYINEVQYGSYTFKNVANGLTKHYIDSGAANPVSSYVDAIGYSWDTEYSVGDNLVQNSFGDLEFNVDLNLDDFSSLNNLNVIYSYKTDIYQLIDLLIYNFDNSEYDLIESAANLTFQNGYFGLNSSYYNSTKDLILKFEMSNDTYDFRLYIEMLKIRNTSCLNFTTHVSFETLTNLLQLDVKSYQRSNISQLIEIMAWNYTSNSWGVLDSESFTSSFQLSEYSNAFLGFVNNDGNVLLNYYGINKTHNFRFEIDALNITLYRKTFFIYEKTLQLLGTWKYRFKLNLTLYNEHITDWIYFNVIEQQPNFEGISESRYSTRWVLTSTATTGELTEMYYDDLDSGSWVMDDYSDQYISEIRMFAEDTYVDIDHPATNYGQDWSLWVYSDSGVEERRTYLGSPEAASGNYFAGNNSFPYDEIYFSGDRGYGNGASLPFDFYLHTTQSFDEDAVTWNNKGWSINHRDTYSYTGGWGEAVILDTGYKNGQIYYYYISVEVVNPGYFYQETTGFEGTGKSVWLIEHYTKFYHSVGGGYAYIQSNKTEVLGLVSPKLSSNTSLSEGDVFTVDLQSPSDNALLKLYSGGILQQTINLLIANTETSRQEVEVIVSEDVSFDQIKITSELSDTEYFKLYDIKAEHWVFESEEDQKIMYVEPFGQNELILNLGNNSLKIYENDILRTNIYITMTYDLTTHIFESPIPETVFVSFYDSNNDYLEFNIFTTYVNYTLFEENFINQRLTSREFYVDEDSTIYFNVYDSFDINIYSASRLAKTFIDITLSVYTLKIKNEALDDSSYTLTKGSVPKTGILFPDEIDEYKIASGSYTFAYIKGTDPEESIDFTLSGDKLLKINRSQMCFLSYTNQRGEYLNFNQFKTYWNGTLLYENVFYEDIGNNVSIEIKDHYDISVKNHSFIVSSGDNYIPVILTMYSLKVFNQQEVFNHINITRNPNYYESGYSWSEWVAPTEIIEFTLFAGYYKINLTDNENSGSSYYSYTLNGDDILLISSGNIISNVIINIANVNATLGNQITNVEINITNQNSQINNSIINVEINLGNINSTLGNMLVNIDLDITNIANNITSLYTFTNNSFINLDNNINNSFIYIENNIISINQSISNLVIGISNDIYLINGTISTMITQMENNLLLMNVSINTALFDLDTTLSQIGNNITNNYILLNNSITLANNNINDSRIAIINNLALINNTISNLISQVYSSVYMINNSIYTAVVDVGTSLLLINNTISGNLSIILEQNDFLTELYQTTMFSDLLNWTNIGYDSSLIDSQIDVWEFINNYKNQSIEVHLRYQDIIDNLTITAQNSIFQYLPKYDTDYNLWSVEDQEYLDDWKPLPENRTIPFGFYEETIPDIPDFNAPNTVLMIVLILMACGSVIALVGYMAYRYRKKSENYRRSYADKISLEAKTIKNFSQGTRIK